MAMFGTRRSHAVQSAELMLIPYCTSRSPPGSTLLPEATAFSRAIRMGGATIEATVAPVQRAASNQ